MLEKIRQFFAGPSEPRRPLREWAKRWLGPCETPPDRVDVVSAVDRYYPGETVKDIVVRKRMFPAGGVPKKTYLAHLKVEVRFQSGETLTVDVGEEESSFA